jgi:hypothetical protein
LPYISEFSTHLNLNMHFIHNIIQQCVIASDLRLFKQHFLFIYVKKFWKLFLHIKI